MKSDKNSTLFWIWLMMLVAYLDRVNIFIAAPTIQRSLHMSSAAFGWALGAFTLGYALMQIPGGLLADKFGARPILVTALALWSAFTALTGTARSGVNLIVIRLLFGTGEGIENGAQFKLIADNFTPRERSRANALFLTALAIGPALAAPIVSHLIAAIGWRALFYSFAGLGLTVALLIALFLPKTDPGRTVHTETGSNATWRDVLKHSGAWLPFAVYLLFNMAFWGYLSWMPSYLDKARHIDLKQLGYLASIPYLFGLVGMGLLGWLGSGALARFRSVMIGASYLLAGVCLFVAYTATGITHSMIGLSLAAFFLFGGFGPFWAVALEGIPDNLRGAYSGFVNFGGQIGGFIAQVAIGEIVTWTGSFTDGFLVMIAALIIAAMILVRLQSANTQLRALADDPAH